MLCMLALLRMSLLFHAGQGWCPLAREAALTLGLAKPSLSEAREFMKCQASQHVIAKGQMGACHFGLKDQAA